MPSCSLVQLHQKSPTQSTERTEEPRSGIAHSKQASYHNTSVLNALTMLQIVIAGSRHCAETDLCQEAVVEVTLSQQEVILESPKVGRQVCMHHCQLPQLCCHLPPHVLFA